MRLTPRVIHRLKGRRKIAALTAYDFPSARILDEARIDIILVGDSLGMVMLGYDTTLPVTMEAMVHHTAAVSRGASHSLVVADMPYRSYRTPAEAVKNAKLLIKAGAKAVKLEGGAAAAKQVRALRRARIPVMGHVGMLPQSVKRTGGYKVQGRTPDSATRILKDALLLDRLGVFALVLECIPAELGRAVTRAVRCPTIGIGAGPSADGQILVLHDMLGFSGKVHPRFVRRYADLEDVFRSAAQKYGRDVRRGKFPSKKESY